MSTQANPALNLATFAATHNSYSGGSRGSVPQQLQLGCRIVELDLWNSDYARYGDFRIGHLWAGNDVSHDDGNPASNNLRDWVQLVASWCAANPGHAPVSLTLDLKSNLSKASDGQGSLADLEAELLEILGDQLYPASAFPGAWPAVDDLRGRIFVVLSGNQDSRKAWQARYGTPGDGAGGPLFVEYQKGDSSQLQGGPIYAASHSDLGWVQDAVYEGKAARAWGFNSKDTVPPPVTWPATDDPTAAWYQQYLAEVGAIT